MHYSYVVETRRLSLLPPQLNLSIQVLHSPVNAKLAMHSAGSDQHIEMDETPATELVGKNGPDISASTNGNPNFHIMIA